MISVAVNLAWLVPGDVGGSEEYTTRLLASVLRAAPSDISLEVVASKRLTQNCPWMEALPLSVVAGPLGNRGYRILAESTQVHRATRNADLVHHFGGRLPALRNPRSIVTIHDLQPLDLPANFSRAKRRYLCWAVQRSAAAASLICTPSDWVAQSVVDRLGVDPDKVRVVPSTWTPQRGDANGAGGAGGADDAGDAGGAGGAYGAGGANDAGGAGGADDANDARRAGGADDAYGAGGADDAGDADALAVDGLADRLGSGPVVLYPAATHPHKNHLLLLEAVDRLADRGGDLTLVLTGGRGRAETLVEARLRRSRARVLRLGRVSGPLLSALTRRADILAFPSGYEGFGLPLLEAMVAGTPVVAGDNSAMPEVVADAGLLVGVNDPDCWADAIEEVVADPSLADRLSAAGRVRAEAYAPAVSARRLISVWREAL